MNRRQFALILLALAMVGSAGLILLNRNRLSWTVHEARVGDKVLPNFNFNDVAAIHIKSPAGDFNVVHKAEAWCVPERSDYPANYQQIKDVLIRLRDLKVAQSDTVGPSQFGRVGLADPTAGDGGGTLLEFKDTTGKNLASLIVGKRHLRPQSQSDPFRMKGLFDGCYVRLPSDPQNVLLTADDLAGAASEPQAWLSRNFVKIENVKSISLISSNGSNLWTLLREAESRPWSLADAPEGEMPDSTATSQAAEILPFLTFIDVLPRSSQEAAVLNKPMTLFVETFDHFFYTLKVGMPGRDGNYLLNASVRAAVEAGKENAKELQDKLAREQAFSSWVYVVESAAIEPLLRDRSRFLEKKSVAGQESFAPLQLSERQR